MQIAWTSLFHAIFLRRRVKPFHRGKGGRRFVMVDGEPKRWEIEECVKQYWLGQATPVTQNLRFMTGLRNKIEHRELPELDVHVLGECQALLFNFEALLAKEFGDQYSINENLVIPLQLSKLRPRIGGDALRQLIRPLPEDLHKWVQAFRTSLEDTEIDSPEFSFRVLLIPELKNNPARDSLAVQFVTYTPGQDSEMDRAVALIKRSQLPVVNQGLMKPGEVVDHVQKRLAGSVKISMEVHTRCWKFFGVRPPRGDARPEVCLTKFCIYDATHKDYVYTAAWVDFLVLELSKSGRLAEIMHPEKVASPVAENRGMPSGHEQDENTKGR
jgi:hypothetical protein